MGVVTTIALATAAVATGASIYNSNRAARAQQRQLEFQQQQSALAQNRQRREQIRNARIARANSLLAGAEAGALDSSGVRGGTDSILSQLGSNLGFSIQMQALSDQAGEQAGKAIRFGNRAQLFGGIAQLALTAASFAPNKADVSPVEDITGKLKDNRAAGLSHSTPNF